MPIWTSSAPDYQRSCLPLMLWLKLTINVRISIGPSSTTRLEGSTGPPRTTLSAGGPCTFHFRRFFSMAARSWFADKLVSMNLSIWSHVCEMGSRIHLEMEVSINQGVTKRTFLSGNTLLRSTRARFERFLCSPAYLSRKAQNLGKQIEVSFPGTAKLEWLWQNLV